MNNEGIEIKWLLRLILSRKKKGFLWEIRVRGFTISPFVQLFRQALIALKSRCDHYNDTVTVYV